MPGAPGWPGCSSSWTAPTLGTEDTSSPYSVSWNTTTVANGTHTLTAVARDAAGNITTSTPVTVKVDNAAPAVSLTAPATGDRVGHGDPGRHRLRQCRGGRGAVQGGRRRLGPEDTTAPYGVSWNTTTVTTAATR